MYRFPIAQAAKAAKGQAHRQKTVETHNVQLQKELAMMEESDKYFDWQAFIKWMDAPVRPTCTYFVLPSDDLALTTQSTMFYIPVLQCVLSSILGPAAGSARPTVSRREGRRRGHLPDIF